MKSILKMTKMLTLVVIWFVCCYKQGTFASYANDSIKFTLKGDLHILGDKESRYLNRPYLSYVTRVSNRTRSFKLIKNAKTFHRWALDVKADVIIKARNAQFVNFIVTSRSARPDDVIHTARNAQSVDAIATSRSARPDDVIHTSRNSRSVDAIVTSRSARPYDVIPAARNARSVDAIVTSRSARPDDVIHTARKPRYVDTIVTPRSDRPDDVILRARNARSVDAIVTSRSDRPDDVIHTSRNARFVDTIVTPRSARPDDVIHTARNAQSVDAIATSRSARPDDVIHTARNARFVDTIVTPRSDRPDDVILRARNARFVDAIATSRSARPDDVIHTSRNARSVDRMYCQTDEVPCLYSGLCISKLSICDDNADCIYEEDEKYCSKTDCLASRAFRCHSSGECISYKYRCSGYGDCWDKSDEVGCHNSTCPEHWFRCNNSQCVEQRKRCDGNNYEISEYLLKKALNMKYFDGTRDEVKEKYWSRDADGNYVISDCSDGSDEWNCEKFICPANHFKCRNGQCVHLSTRCDNNAEYRDYFIQDCNDGSDEEDCEKSDCGDYFRCSDGRCLPPSGVCDNIAQCSDAGDETDCHLYDNSCPMHTFSCGRGHCVSYVYRCTGQMLAPANDVMNQCQSSGMFPYLYEIDCPLSKCPTGYFRCRTGQCMQYDICNKRDNTYFCDEKNDPIDHCGRTDCPRDYFRCETGHCLHHISICDNVTDCAGGEDEAYCGRSECRNGQVNCGDGNCVPITLKCDGYNHCEHGQDEQSCEQYTAFMKEEYCAPSFPRADYRDISYCTVQCSKECTCKNGLVDCSSETFTHTGLLGKKDIWPFTTISSELDWPIPYWAARLARIYGLVLSYSLLEIVPIGVLRFTPYVQILDLSHNVLTHLKRGDFDGLYRLSLLDVSYNRIQTVDDFTFEGLRVLNLHLENNDIQHFGYDLFGGMAADGVILTDSYRLCCLRPASLPAQHCVPAADHFTSCDNLVRYVHVRVLLWIISLFAIFGNLGAIWRRLFLNKSTNQKLCGFCIVNLHISDLLMGIYLLIIAIADATFRGRYNIEDKRWREGFMCTLGGMLSFVWNVSSPMVVLLITVDRYLSIKYPFGEKRVSFRTAVALTAIAWTSSIVLAIVPLVVPGYFQDSFYSNSEICLAIPLSTRRMTGWQYETGVYIGIHSLFFSLIVTGQITIMRKISATKSKTLSSSQISEIRFTKSLVFIVLMNVLCWGSVGIGAFLAMLGADVTQEFFSWWVILVLPFKTLLNPSLYMLMVR